MHGRRGGGSGGGRGGASALSVCWRSGGGGGDGDGGAAASAAGAPCLAPCLGCAPADTRPSATCLQDLSSERSMAAGGVRVMGRVLGMRVRCQTALLSAVQPAVAGVDGDHRPRLRKGRAGPAASRIASSEHDTSRSLHPIASSRTAAAATKLALLLQTSACAHRPAGMAEEQQQPASSSAADGPAAAAADGEQQQQPEGEQVRATARPDRRLCCAGS